MEELISPKEAAKILGVCRDTLRNWAKDGKIIALTTPGGHRRYKKADVENLLKTGEQKLS